MMLLQSSWLLLCLVFVLNNFLTIPPCHCHSSSPQNIETFYPNETSATKPTPQNLEPPPPSPQPQPSLQAQDQAPGPVAASRSISSKGKIAIAVAASAARKEDEENEVKNFKSFQEIPLHRGKSSSSHIKEDEPYRITRIPHNASSSASTPLSSFLVSDKKQDSPIQPYTATLQSSPSPASTLPPPPPITARKSPSPPPPPPKEGGSLKSNPIKQRNSSGKGSMPDTSNAQLKLKPLHWDKVNTNNVDHSMVWDKVDDGSFRYSIL
ncbi:unnamed protein product [Lupinus luteus]|uniref:Uncharacterized protein n=1 Tax=Lupinus luteus TaxID=3873 RepID=A0AAV1WW64_LUPLU